MNLEKCELKDLEYFDVLLKGMVVENSNTGRLDKVFIDFNDELNIYKEFISARINIIFNTELGKKILDNIIGNIEIKRISYYEKCGDLLLQTFTLPAKIKKHAQLNVIEKFLFYKKDIKWNDNVLYNVNLVFEHFEKAILFEILYGLSNGSSADEVSLKIGKVFDELVEVAHPVAKISEGWVFDLVVLTEILKGKDTFNV